MNKELRRFFVAIPLFVALGLLVTAALAAATRWETGLCGGLAAVVFAALLNHIWPPA